MALPTADLTQLLTTIVTQIGPGVTGGFVVGYGIKKAALFLLSIALKIAAGVAGLFVLGLMGLEALGVIKVDYVRLASLFEQVAAQIAAAVMWLVPEVANAIPTVLQFLPLSGSFGVGAVAGVLKH